jgi:hypothetical protein
VAGSDPVRADSPDPGVLGGAVDVLTLGVIFYTLIFAAVAVLAIAAGITYVSRSRRRMASEEHQTSHNAQMNRRTTKDRRKQSAKARRKRS